MDSGRLDMTSLNFNQNAQSASNVKPVLKMSAATLDSSPGLGGRELDLQRTIVIVNDQYKSLKNEYETLKDQNTRLQEELNLSQNENKRLLNDKQALQEKMKLEIVELQFNLLARTKELQELHRERNTPQNLEFLRTQVLKECEASFREKFTQLVKENEMYNSEHYKLQYECCRLSAQLDQQKDEHNRKLNLQEARYQGEISCLEKEKEELLARCKALDTSSGVKQLEVLKRERSQFILQLQGLKAEVAELHAQKENLNQQVENTQRVQIKQQAESQTMLKTVKTEQELLRLQLERIQKELDVSHEQNSQLTKLLHKAEGEVNSLTSQIENLKCTQKQEVSRITLEYTKCKGELQKETDKLQMLNDGLQSDTEVLKAVVAQHEQLLVEKQRELDRRVQSVRDEEFHKTMELKEEKLELENRLAVLEQQRALKDTADEVQKGEWEARLCSAQNETELTLRELQNLRTKLQQQSSQLVELERQRALSADLQQQNKELGVQLKKLSHSESELTAVNQQLKENLERVREHLKTTEKNQQEAERVFHDQHLEWMEEKNMLRRNYSEAKKKLQRASAAQKKRKILTEKKEKKFEYKIQLMEAKIVELELEVAAAKKQVSTGAERAELKRLKEVVRRYDVFGRILLEGTSGGNRGLPASLPVPVTVRPEDEQHQEISQLQRRLDDVENMQQQLVEELESVMPKEPYPTQQPDL